MTATKAKRKPTRTEDGKPKVVIDPDPDKVLLAFITWWKNTEQMADYLHGALKDPDHPLYKAVPDRQRDAALVAVVQVSEALTNDMPYPLLLGDTGLRHDLEGLKLAE